MRSIGLLKLALVVVLAAALFMPGICWSADGSHRFSAQLVEVFETEGIDALELLYRRQRERGFMDVRESQADTNALGT